MGYFCSGRATPPTGSDGSVEGAAQDDVIVSWTRPQQYKNIETTDHDDKIILLSRQIQLVKEYRTFRGCAATASLPEKYSTHLR